MSLITRNVHQLTEIRAWRKEAMGTDGLFLLEPPWLLRADSLRNVASRLGVCPALPSRLRRQLHWKRRARKQEALRLLLVGKGNCYDKRQSLSENTCFLLQERASEQVSNQVSRAGLLFLGAHRGIFMKTHFQPTLNEARHTFK